MIVITLLNGWLRVVVVHLKFSLTVEEIKNRECVSVRKFHRGDCESQKQPLMDVDVNDVHGTYMHWEKGKRKGLNDEKEEQGGRERSTVKGKIGSGGTFYEKTIYRGAHASIVHNKCHSNDARGFYEEPAIVSLDLHEIDKNMEHLAFESSKRPPTTGEHCLPILVSWMMHAVSRFFYSVCTRAGLCTSLSIWICEYSRCDYFSRVTRIGGELWRFFTLKYLRLDNLDWLETYDVESRIIINTLRDFD